MQLSLNHCPAPSPQVAGQVVQNEAVLVQPERGEARVLNEVGAYIWELVDGVRSVQEIAAAVAAHYEVDVPQAEADTLAFVGELLEHQILMVKDSPASSR